MTNQLREMISLHHAVSKIDIVVAVVFSVELKLYFKRCDKHAKNRLLNEHIIDRGIGLPVGNKPVRGLPEYRE